MRLYHLQPLYHLVLFNLLCILCGCATVKPQRLATSELYLSGASDPQTVEAHVHASVEALVKFGPWTREQVETSIRGYLIAVRPEHAWSYNGQMVQGQTFVFEGRVLVGMDLQALCHEFAHVVEWVVEHKQNTAHAGWTERGINRAQAESLK